MVTKVDFKPDGSFSSNCTYFGFIGVANIEGKWQVRDRALVWYYPHAGVETEDINPILEFSPERFVIQEMSGALTTFTKLP